METEDVNEDAAEAAKEEDEHCDPLCWGAAELAALISSYLQLLLLDGWLAGFETRGES